MGDYTKNGIKIGTCGTAYYATKKQLESMKYDSEARYYLNPENKCRLAFPLPEFDNKQIGEISIFHLETFKLPILQISSENKTFHKKIVHHIHPAGGNGINLFCDCPSHSSENVSTNFDSKNVLFYLRYETFTGEGDNMAIVGECIYCGELNVFEESEALEACENLLKEAQYNRRESARPEYINASNKDFHLKKASELEEIVKRIKNTYKIENNLLSICS
jgi:hypothetical protein